MNFEYDSIVIGGGLVGAAVACGLTRKGKSVAMFDGDDRDFRASRGNFGLIWVQGKGSNNPAYARWTSTASKLWPAFSQELIDATGIDIAYRQNGGVDFCLDESEWQMRRAEMELVSQHTNGNFEYKMLEHSALRKMIPQISHEVLGASYSEQDAHVNPLYLLRALHQLLVATGGCYHGNQKVISIHPRASGFSVQTASHEWHAEQVVLCAGLENQRLGEELEMTIPVSPLRGQLLITERVGHFLDYPSAQIRQTAEGTLQIGDSHEAVGLDDGTTLDVMTAIAARAIRIFPHLKSTHLVRAWGALRVMTPDGAPIYHASKTHPGAYAISCHSGVTLAAAHTDLIADWISGQAPDNLIAQFDSDRFDVSTH